MAEVRRSPSAAALLNLTGLGLGYAYLGRGWRQVLHLIVTAGLVVIAFATGAAALPWLWVAVAALWLGWMAADGWRIARGWFAPPEGARGRAVPVAVALVAVGAVVTGHVLYGAAGRATYAAAAAARDAGDCAAARDGFGLVTGVYELTLSGDVARADAGGEECAAFLRAGEAAAGGDLDAAVRAHREFRATRPGSVLQPFVDADLARLLGEQGAALRAAGDLDRAIGVYRDLLAEVAGEGTAETAAREELATTYTERAADLRGRIPALTGDEQAAAVRGAVENLLTAQRDLPGTRGAAAAPQGVRDVYAAVAGTWAGRPCDALPVLEYVVGLADQETGGAATAAGADRPRLLFACGLARYGAADHDGAAEVFDALVTAYPADAQAAQARANAIAARSARASGTAPALPGPYAGDAPGPISVTFFNDNPSEVRVYVVGPTAHEFVLPGCPGCPPDYPTEGAACPSTDGRPSLELRLPAGTYSIVGEYPAADPSVSSNAVESGFVYTNCLYVVSS
ncbi:MAG: hypothetical protein NTW05_03195 [Pseudonocardiales bacterium]|nr:hypothetical protein [Pseudonocardiales bacterium]